MGGAVSGYDPSTGRRRVRQLGTFETKRAAVAHQKAAAAGRAGGDADTLAEFLERVWLPAEEGRVEVGTYDQYRWAVSRHIVPLIGAVRLGDLTPELVDQWVGEISTAPAGGKARLGAASARLVRKILSMALEQAVQRGRLARNPVPLTQPPRRARPHGRLGWTLDEVRALLTATVDHRLRAAFHLCLVTGLRRREILAVRWNDVDLYRCQLTVVQPLAVERGRPVLKQLKTEASERIVTFGQATRTTLTAHRDRQQAEAEFAGVAWTDSGLVFTTALGGWIDPNNFGRLMDALIESAGVPRITPKGMRHTAQSLGRVVVGDVKVMPERLGHADTGVTLNTYTHRFRAAPAGGGAVGRAVCRADVGVSPYRVRTEQLVDDALVVVPGWRPRYRTDSKQCRSCPRSFSVSTESPRSGPRMTLPWTCWRGIAWRSLKCWC
jgi:integrase